MSKMRRLAFWLTGFEFVLVGAWSVAAPLPQAADQRALKLLLANVGPQPTLGLLPGVVIAGTSKAQPDYFYHWVRDASLVMNVVTRLAENTPATRKRFDGLLSGFAAFTRTNQETHTLAGLGEPKFYIDGKAYLEPWGRPQNDGPALRATTMMRWATRLLTEGRRNEVVPNLYDAKLPSNALIKRDLEFVAHHWQEPCFDLWEEISGTHFYTRLAQRRALLDGAVFAERLGDSGAAEFYRAQAKAISSQLPRFWDAKKNVIVPTLQRNGGIDYKSSDLDSSVLLAILHSGNATGEWSPSDRRVQSTLKALVEKFRTIYPINGNGKPGVALGRYPEDRYDGYSTGHEGNPWFIATLAAAELSYRAKKRSDGDAFFQRALAHMTADGRMTEQFNRNTGEQQGATDLTWSFAAYVSAALARDGYN